MLARPFFNVRVFYSAVKSKIKVLKNDVAVDKKTLRNVSKINKYC